jgi:hypothetical protein
MNLQRITRSYTMTNLNDESHTINGRCPNYALLWDIKHNIVHWPKGHDYYIGNGCNINDESRELREILSERLAKDINTKNLIFCDLDGVLANFEGGVENLFKKKICDINVSTLWSTINKSTTFFETLPWMSKGKELWERIKEYHPIIITGIPPGSKSAAEQKIRWCRRELGEDIKVITCLTKENPKYCYGRSILIDDREETIKAWKDKGGQGILYTEENLYQHLERIDRHMDYTVYVHSP